MEKKKYDPLWKFSELNVDEAKRLLAALAMEEDGQDTDLTALHVPCASREHSHQNNTASLVISPKRKKEGNKWVEVGTGIGWCKCFGSCKFNGSLSDYLKKVGPEGASDKFWSEKRVLKVIADLKQHDKPFELGWKVWKDEKGYQSTGKLANINHEKGQGAAKQNHDNLRKHYRTLFTEARRNPSLNELVDKICLKRKWQKDVLMGFVNEGVVGISDVSSIKDEVMIAFAYRGFFNTSPGFPVRFIKTRYLNRNQKDDKNSRLTYTDPNASNEQIGDFSGSGVDFQNSKRIVFLEGEPDAISWRHIFPDDAVICIGNTNAYNKLPEVLKMMNLKGREVIYVIDRDYNKVTNQPVYDIEKHEPLFKAIWDEEPSALKAWMCPKIENKDCKDVNDFLKHFGPKETILNACIDVPSETLSMPVCQNILSKAFALKAK